MTDSSQSEGETEQETKSVIKTKRKSVTLTLRSSPVASANPKESQSEGERDQETKRDQGDKKRKRKSRSSTVASGNPNESKEQGRKRRKRPDNKKNNRQQCACPLSGCLVDTVNMRRHFKRTHLMSAEEARDTYYMYKPQMKQAPKGTYVACPNCPSVLKKECLQKHLIRNCKGGKLAAAEATRLAKLVREGALNEDDDDDDDDDHEDEVNDEDLEESHDEYEHVGDENEEDEDQVDDSQRHELTRESEEVVESFHRWLTSIDGGTKAERTADQYRDCINTITATEMKGDVRNINAYDLFSQPDHFFEEFRKNHSASTVTNYMHALVAFMNFAKLNQRVMGAYLDREECTVAVLKIGNWIASMRKPKALQRQAARDRDERVVPESADLIRKYKHSEHFKQAVAIFDCLQMSGDVADPEEYLHLRNYIMIRLLVANGQRTGGVVNLTYKEYVEMHPVDGDYVAKVHQHKTDYIFGPVRLAMDDTMKRHLDIYVSIRDRYLRNRVGMAKDEARTPTLPLFLNKDGNEMHSNSLARVIDKVLRDLGKELGWDLQKESNLTPTVLRKASYLLGDGEKGMSQQDLEEHAKHASHSVTTARTIYDSRNRDKIAVKVSRRMMAAIDKPKVIFIVNIIPCTKT